MLNLSRMDVYNIVPGIENVGPPVYGGQKAVFRCEIQGVPYALKFMAYDTKSTEGYVINEVVERARREVAVMSSCESPYIVKLGPIGLTKVVFQGRHLLYFTEQWIDGVDLDTRIAKCGRLPPQQVRQLGMHMTAAIGTLWANRKVHRDIKPGNIMLSQATSQFVLLDFGIALDLDGFALTRTGATPGTLLYLSPEQARRWNHAQDLDFRSDLFSLGVVMYQCATGKHPFYTPGMSQGEIIDSLCNSAPPAPTELFSYIPEGLSAIIMRLMAKQPHLRFRTCSLLRAHLEKLREKE